MLFNRQKRTKSMKVMDIKESSELCTEACWIAYDLILDKEINGDVIRKLGDLGSLLYLSGLKEPFYRIENRLFMIKGIEGKKNLRVAMLIGEEQILETVKQIVESFK